jgi:hypothetical protein
MEKEKDSEELYESKLRKIFSELLEEDAYQYLYKKLKPLRPDIYNNKMFLDILVVELYEYVNRTREKADIESFKEVISKSLERYKKEKAALNYEKSKII